jgi:hypothetical protein
MVTNKFKDEALRSQYTMFEIDDFEYLNPILKACEMIVSSSMEAIVGQIEFKRDNGIISPINARQLGDFLESTAHKDWENYFKQIQSQELSPTFYKLLEANSNDEQFNLLKGASLTSSQLMKFIFDAWERSGYTYSFYKSHHNHNGVSNTDLPDFAYKNEENEIKKIGRTEMSDGAIKHAINYQKTNIARFIEKDDTWHCFFYTTKSMNGEERGSDGKPHLHYISDKWRISREEVIFQLKSKNYKLPSKLPHINFIK